MAKFNGNQINISLDNVVRVIAVSQTETEIIEKIDDEWKTTIVESKFIDVISLFAKEANEKINDRDNVTEFTIKFSTHKNKKVFVLSGPGIITATCSGTVAHELRKTIDLIGGQIFTAAKNREHQS